MSVRLGQVNRMHLNIFLPPRGPRENGRPGRIGPMRRVLRVLGLTWEAAPVRRLFQVAALAVFLALFFYVCWPYTARDQALGHAGAMKSREALPAELFLALDPLVSISTAVGARMWVWSLAWAGALLAASLAWPRAFCGYLCPLGTLIDLADWTACGRAKQPKPRRPFDLAQGGSDRSRMGRRGWWVNLRYYLLAGILAAAVGGALLSGFFAAIAVLTRGMLFIGGSLQLGLMRGWYQVPPMGLAQWVSIALFAGVFAASFAGRRFWCRCLCPTGAVFSATSALRVTERRVDSKCIRCNRCVRACPFDAIRPDYSTRHADCTFCQTCGGVCPVNAIRFTTRWSPVTSDLAGGAPQSTESGLDARADRANAPLSRRGFLAGIAAGLATAALARGRMPALGAEAYAASVPVRPPGSAPETEFLRLCIACGECMKACPNNVLQPAGLQYGLAGLWMPQVAANWAGCDPGCNICGQVCPTGAIRALPLEEKRAAHIGLAAVNARTCLPWAGREACQMCYDECKKAGYDAIEFERTGVETDEVGAPVEGTGYSAPKMLPENCVGCGLCQTRCFAINVKEKHLLAESAIIVHAGPGREDRLLRGSYRALRDAERRRREAAQPPRTVKYNSE